MPRPPERTALYQVVARHLPAFLGQLDEDGSRPQRSDLVFARASVGLSDPSDDEAARHLATWLGTQDQRLDAIVWIGRADPQQPVRTGVVARRADVAQRVASAIDEPQVALRRCREHRDLISRPSCARVPPARSPAAAPTRAPARRGTSRGAPAAARPV